MSVVESPKEEEQILDVLGIIEKLGEQLDQFEKLKETIDSTKESASRLIPSMKEEKKLLKKKTRQKREKIEQIDQAILKLEKEKAGLSKGLQSEEHEISRIDAQMQLISRLS